MNSLKSRFQQIREDIIKGGLSDGKSLKDIANKHKVSLEELTKQFEIGQKVEHEHTNNEKIAKEIAKDHLFEDPEYYTKLSKIEKH